MSEMMNFVLSQPEDKVSADTLESGKRKSPHTNHQGPKISKIPCASALGPGFPKCVMNKAPTEPITQTVSS